MEELSLIWERYKKNGDESAREALVKNYIPLVERITRDILKKLPPTADFDDLASDGTIGLLKALKYFELERGLKFETYATPVIRGSIFNGLRSLDWVPERIRGKTRALQKAMDRLYAISGKSPTEEQLAAELKISAEDVYEVIASLSTVYLLSLEQPVILKGDQKEVTLQDTIEDTKNIGLLEGIEFAEERQTLKKAINYLDERDRILVQRYYFEGISFEKIAVELNVTKQRISQVHSRAIKRLRNLIISIKDGHLK